MPECVVSDKYKYVAGVDTHAKSHYLSLVDNVGKLVGEREIKVIPHLMEKGIAWVLKITEGNVLFAVEGTSSYGETFTVALQRRNLPVCEAKAPKVKIRGQAGKTDEIDSLLAARSTLAKPLSKLINPKSQGMAKILRILLAARRNMTTQMVMDKNALIALLRTNIVTADPISIMTMPIARKISIFSSEPDASTSVETYVAKMEAKRLAQHILFRQSMLTKNKDQLQKVVRAFAPSLLDLPGFGSITSAQILCSYSHKGRFRSADAFACLAGTTPLPASSGEVIRHRLSRYGDRTLNSALTTIVQTRIKHHQPTQEYVTKRIACGKSRREIKRSLKHYLAKSVFKHLEKLDLDGSHSFCVSEDIGGNDS